MPNSMVTSISPETMRSAERGRRQLERDRLAGDELVDAGVRRALLVRQVGGVTGSLAARRSGLGAG